MAAHDNGEVPDAGVESDDDDSAGVTKSDDEVAADLPTSWAELGAFIREQRSQTRLSLRKLAEMADVSNPYLSQIERGLRKPSAEILQQIARALSISSESLYIRAGILDERTTDVDVEGEIRRDHTLTGDQRDALIQIYRSFRAEAAADGGESSETSTR